MSQEFDYFENDKIKKSRKDHICSQSQCKKKISKGTSYYRRSFGQVWTWKACSQECAFKLEKESSMLIY